MKEPLINMEMLKGKTYSLYGNKSNSDEYYRIISLLTENFIKSFGDEKIFLKEINKIIDRKRLPNKIYRDGKNYEQIIKVAKELKEGLSVYTTEIEHHLKTLPLSKKIKKVFTLSEHQYHLYMLFIELANRINTDNFKNCEYKIAFLPHCIKNRSVTCMSVKDNIDYRCKNCSKICQINLLSKTLRKNKINPYIWMTADLKKLFKVLKQNNSSVGVLGIACIPEMVNGMRFCGKYKFPVVGIPLDANRCVRWMDDFYDNTINFNRLNELLN